MEEEGDTTIDIVKGYVEHLKSQTQLMPSSIETYRKIIAEMILQEGIDPSAEKLNEFITMKARKRQQKAKYAVKHYLDYRWRKGVYYELSKMKTKSPIRKSNHLSYSQAKETISRIRKEKYSLIARMQYATGARPAEILSIMKENVKYDKENKWVQVKIIGKGDKADYIYLDGSYWDSIKSYSDQNKEHRYLFLRDGGKHFDAYEERKMVEREYRYYYNHLKVAGKSIGIDMSPHDWRRSFAEQLRTQGVDPFTIQQALRHKNFTTTQRYFQHDQKNISKTMLKHQAAI